MNKSLRRFVFSVLVYVAFWFCFGAFVLFVGDFGVLKSVGHEGAMVQVPGAIAFNLALILLFALQHSLMARPAFKSRWAGRPAAALERPCYVLASIAALAVLMAAWQPIGGSIWSVDSAFARGLLHASFVAGWLLILVATLQIDHWHFFGLRQTWSAWRGEATPEPEFRESGLYAWLRHPIHAGMLMALWSAPDMSGGRLLLAGVLTLYVWFGLRLEERDLQKMLGIVYREYQLRVPRLLPGTARIRTLAVVLLAGGLLVALAPTGARAEITRAALPVEQLQVDGRVRSFRLYTPERRADRPALVIALHGSGGDGERMRSWIGPGLEQLADVHGFLIAYPDGFEGHWNDCRKAAQYSAARLQVDDVAFLIALTDFLAATAQVDPGRVAVLGFSNGGQMTYRLALEAPDSFRAFAVVAAGLPAAANLDCVATDGEPPPVLMIFGAADPINPAAGGPVILNGHNHGGEVRAAVDSARYFARRCCALAAHKVRGPHGDLLRTWFRGAMPWVVLHLHAGAGHTIPQSHVRFPEFLGPTRQDVDAMEIAWDFLAPHLGFVTGPEPGPVTTRLKP